MITIRRAEERGHAGDGAALSEVPAVQIEGIDGGEVLVFDLA